MPLNNDKLDLSLACNTTLEYGDSNLNSKQISFRPTGSMKAIPNAGYLPAIVVVPPCLTI